jgi:hypothetical protein
MPDDQKSNDQNPANEFPYMAVIEQASKQAEELGIDLSQMLTLYQLEAISQLVAVQQAELQVLLRGIAAQQEPRLWKPRKGGLS